MLALNEPPLLHLTYPSVEDGAKECARDQRRHHAARTLSADLAIHARAAVEIHCRDHSGDRRALRLRIRVAQAGRRGRDRAGEDVERRYGGDSREISRRLRRRRERGAQGARHRALRRGQSARAPPGAVQMRRTVRPAAAVQRLGAGAEPRQRPPLSCRRRQGDVPDHAGFDQALDAAFGGRHRRRDEGAVRAHHRRSGQIRHAVMRAVAAESPAGGPLRRRAASSSPAMRRIWSFRPAGSA